jgi:penicillin-binding protein 1A
MKKTRKILRWMLVTFTTLSLLGLLTLVAIYFHLAPGLPSVDSLRDVGYQVPLRVYTTDEQLIAEYGVKIRDPLSYDEIPDTMVKAIIAAEDDRFFVHPGVDYQGIIRAVVNLVLTGEKSQGGSTITMQVARNFFLSLEKTYLRKLNEIFLSFKIERELSKEQILELYLNKIPFGNRAYGIGSAARIYYGQSLNELNLAQYAMLAGLPKAPSANNPIANPNRAIIRRNYVLGRMLALGFISQADYQASISAGVSVKQSRRTIDVDAPHIGEMVRSYMYDKYGEDAYTSGFRVYVTIDPKLQQHAQKALRQNLLEYEHRHGFRGPVKHIDYSAEHDVADYVKQLGELPSVGGLKPALVTKTEGSQLEALLADGSQIIVEWDGLSWAASYQSTNHLGKAPQTADDIVSPGDIVYLLKGVTGQWQLEQIPHVSGAIVSLNPKDGSIIALVGGFDFFDSKFNRVTQAKRQLGSCFKPFIYSAALEKGFTAASIINDAPVVFDDPNLETPWRPENYSGRIHGPTRLRQALIHSRNLVSIRLLRAIGVSYATEYVQRFGFEAARLPHDLSLSLGSAVFTPLEVATAYSVFANGGYSIEPYFIQRVEDSKGNVIFDVDSNITCFDCEKAELPVLAGDEEPSPSGEEGQGFQNVDVPEDKILAKRVITAQNAYLMTTMMRDVIRYGTGRRALQLKRHDLGGKTGTTNDQRDAWFSGFNGNIVTISWVGFDEGKPLGSGETGGRAALPMWINYMREALADQPEIPLEQPEGLTTVRIDPKSGLLALPDQKGGIFETFRSEHVPTQTTPDKVDEETVLELLF